MEVDFESKYLENLGKGNRQAFESLYMLYYPRLEHFLSGLLKDKAEAEDMAQDIFFKIWVNRESISQVVSFKAYLFRMARNAVYNHYEHFLIKENYVQSQQEKISCEDLIEEKIHAKDLELLITIAVEKMPVQRRKVFKMSRQGGLSNDEIAQQLNISKRTVETHISQALADIRKVILSILLFTY